ncbi:MAG TPA: hypothetical protein VKM72_12550 [Thermoanaerobaculia bacterium]|nr:hypothetical protein [Thermoanaerobaculia bacterium]
MSQNPDRMHHVLRLLTDEVRERIDRHPLGHLLAGRGEPLELHLSVPTALREGRLDQAAREAEETVQAAVQALVEHSSVFQPGRVFCLRCQSSRCEHAAPTDARHVFTGYASTGVPRYRDFGQWLLERRDPRVDLLYREPPQLVAAVSLEPELSGDLIPVDQNGGYRIHGQVAVGWYRAPDPNGPVGHRRPLAVSFQVISSRPQGQRRRFGLNVIGSGPGGEPLEHLWDRLGEIPWNDPVRWTQSVLTGIEHQLAKAPRTPPQVLDQRLDGLINALGRRLEKGARGKERRTQHAERRHQEGDRPTRMALADLARATPENLFFDTRRETLIVLGDRGRTHVFNRNGKLVTSVRYEPAAIEKRRNNGIWRPAATGEVTALRERAMGSPSASGTD